MAPNEHNEKGLLMLLEESIRLELAVSELYRFYWETFEEDEDFWWKLMLEEKNHASLLESGRTYLKLHRLPVSTVHEDIGQIMESASMVEKRLTEFRAVQPRIYDAYCFALKVEESAVEMHMQKLMSQVSHEKVVEIFQRLGQHDVNHMERIRFLMKKKGLGLTCDKTPSRV